MKCILQRFKADQLLDLVKAAAVAAAAVTGAATAATAIKLHLGICGSCKYGS